ncbi:MAG TPA: TlyA family RNA methyltransferase [Rubrobacter sp.]|nr:TlyA family RNA methyltransferase [Rubrobacter sp.]
MQATGRRLDTLMVERGLAETRSRAQGLILAGAVRVGDRIVTKAGTRFPPAQPLSVIGGNRFVSRAGEKLDAALDGFGIEAGGRSCLDAGASTGGFTDVLLKRGAERVLSVDVGYGQLDWSLRQDPRVTVLERTNVRHLKGEDLPFAPNLLVADLSFISLEVALRSLVATTPSLVEAVVLVKPQFEAGPDLVGRGGVVDDPGVRAGVILGVVGSFAALGFGAVDLAPAAVTGRKSGNQEYPLRLLRGAVATVDEGRVREVVSGA